MAKSVEITFSKEMRNLLDKFEDIGPVMSEAVRAGMDTANRFAAGVIKRERYTGNGPFPVSQHKLGHRTRTLIRAFFVDDAEIINADKVEVKSGMGASGMAAKYFGYHEFGTGGMPERAPLRTALESDPIQQIYITEFEKKLTEALENI
jgi:hypothetical protein